MPRKRHKAEEIVAKLRQVDVLTSQDYRQLVLRNLPSLRLTGGTIPWVIPPMVLAELGRMRFPAFSTGICRLAQKWASA